MNPYKSPRLEGSIANDSESGRSSLGRYIVLSTITSTAIGIAGFVPLGYLDDTGQLNMLIAIGSGLVILFALMAVEAFKKWMMRNSS
jgi:hypothetical protein